MKLILKIVINHYESFAFTKYYTRIIYDFFRLPFSYCSAKSHAHTFRRIVKISQQTRAINPDHRPIDIIHHCSRDPRIMCCHERKIAWFKYPHCLLKLSVYTKT